MVCDGNRYCTVRVGHDYSCALQCDHQLNYQAFLQTIHRKSIWNLDYGHHFFSFVYNQQYLVRFD